MAKSVFRKVSLDRLSSPEQLDQKLTVVSSKGWISLLALAVLVIAVVIWGVLGKIPKKVNGNGILLYGDGIVALQAATNGQVTDVSVREGDYVQQGQIIARVAQPEMIEKIVSLQESIAAINRVEPETLTFDAEVMSYETYSTFMQVASEIRAARAQLRAGETEVAKTMQDVENAKNTSRQQVQILQEQISHLEKQIEEYRVLAEYEKKIALQNAQAQDRQNAEQRRRQREADERQREADERMEYELDNAPPTGLYYTGNNGNYYTRTYAMDAQMLVYDQSGRSYTVFLPDYGSNSQLPIYYLDSTGAEIANSTGTYYLPNYFKPVYQPALPEAPGARTILVLYDSMGSMYIDRGGKEFKLTPAGSSYTPDLPDYNYSYSSLPSAANQVKNRPDYDANIASMEGQLVNYKLQLKGAELQASQAANAATAYVGGALMQTEERISILEEQFAAMQTIKSIEFEKAYADLQKQFEQASVITATQDGMILNLVCERNDFVQVGTPLCNIVRQTKATENTGVVMYVPITEGKSIEVGMEVNVSPSTVKREEHGYIIGRVLRVSEYAVTQQSVMSTLRNEQLASAFIGNNAVLEVQIELLRDGSTQSGYKWSTPKGAPANIDPGTVCMGEVLVSSQRPIDMVVPFIKRLFA